ncbi:ribonuclease H [mine drainage metagenome]|uniref:Ribonuclease H n=1 Tax=mine drainage metagenome TaxID=410659 RepID=T1CPQ4_9ZZZZ
MTRQISGEYAVRKEHLKEYHRWLTTLSKGFSEVRFEWIPRAQNLRADELSKQALAEHAAQASKSRAGRGLRETGVYVDPVPDDL